MYNLNLSKNEKLIQIFDSILITNNEEKNKEEEIITNKKKIPPLLSLINVYYS